MDNMQIAVYKFSELSNEAQDVAIAEFRRHHSAAMFLIREAREVLEMKDSFRYFKTGLLYNPSLYN